jgi:nitrous oxide reductase accessory protein NosL
LNDTFAGELLICSIKYQEYEKKGNFMQKIATYLILILLCLMPGSILRAQENDAKEIPVCKFCGMKRDVFAHSRILIEYRDGSKVGVCSLHCAALELALNSGMKPKTILVADYNTKGLLEADKAIWVTGGDKAGVMTRRAKWAFGTKDAADAFIRESGGAIATFDEAMKAAYEDMYSDMKMIQERGEGKMEEHHHMNHGAGGGHHGMDHMEHMGPGAQMLFNPGFGDDIYHTHPADMWMVNYKFMRMAKHGLRAGTDNVDQNNVSPVGHRPFGYMMTPTSMTMDMQMLMVMYGLTDRLTLMAMGSYQSMNMDMLMNMGKGNKDDTPMHTNGIGDTELRGIFGISKEWVASLGVSLPSGDIRQLIGMMGTTYRAPYDMQLGSGSVDLKPALTYSVLSDNKLWNWGAQGLYNYHIDNGNDYTLGDSVKLTTWLQRAFGPAATWLRLSYSDTGKIKGRDNEIQKLLTGSKTAPTPEADPNNYGGQEIDILFGASYMKGPFSFGVEFGLPAYQNMNGLQLKTEWIVNIGIQAMF